MQYIVWLSLADKMGWWFNLKINLTPTIFYLLSFPSKAIWSNIFVLRPTSNAWKDQDESKNDSNAFRKIFRFQY